MKCATFVCILFNHFNSYTLYVFLVACVIADIPNWKRASLNTMRNVKSINLRPSIMLDECQECVQACGNNRMGTQYSILSHIALLI